MASDVAPTLADLMTRLERKRQHYQTQQDYVRLIFVGLLFICIALVTGGMIPLLYLIVLLMVGSPYLLAFYKLGIFRLNEEFLRQALPYFWSQEPGHWTFELHAANFPLAQFKATQLLKTHPSIGNVARGTLNGMPVLMADVVSAARPPFIGMTLRVTTPNPAATAGKIEAMKIGPTMVNDRDVWMLAAAPPHRYGRLTLKTQLNEMAPYEKVQAAIAQMSKLAQAATAQA